jgi:hypothetical protein
MATAAQAADHIYLSISRFRDLVAVGTITRQPTGKYRLDKVREQYCKNAQLVMQGRGAEGGKALSTARARLAEAQAEKAELANAIAKHEYISTTEMRKYIEVIFAVIRENILGLAGKVSDSVAALAPTADRPAIYRLINYEARDLLTGLSEQETMDAACRQKLVVGDIAEATAIVDPAITTAATDD